jgi:hypothetical protein
LARPSLTDRPTFALSNTLEKANISQRARISLVDVERNIVLANPDRSRLLQPLPSTPVVAHLLASERGAMEAPAIDDQPALAAFEPVPGGPWGIIVQQPAAEAFAPLQDLSGTLLELVALSIALAVLAGLLLALHITRPLRTLRAAASSMGRPSNSARTWR